MIRLCKPALGEQASTLWEAYDGWLRRATSVITESAEAP